MAITNRCSNNPIGCPRSFALLLLLVAVVLEGCGGGISVPSTAPVTGVVKYRGKPLQGIRVTLHRPGQASKAEFIPYGESGPDGKFTLGTGAAGNGAPPGSYVVTFEKPVITGSVETEVDERFHQKRRADRIHMRHAHSVAVLVGDDVAKSE